MAKEIVEVLLRQHEIAWSLAWYHLETLSRDECLWRPAAKGLHVTLAEDGSWRGEWPEHEGYDLGPPSIAWVVWHIGFWWSMAINHCFEDASLEPTAIACPGDADAIRVWLQGLHGRWLDLVSNLSDDDLRSHERAKWPFQERALADVVAWVNTELSKNAAELGYARFLYAVRSVT
jgi:hypothetical protein